MNLLSSLLYLHVLSYIDSDLLLAQGTLGRVVLACLLTCLLAHLLASELT